MTEQEWQNYSDVRDFLRGKSNPRRLQLFLCACARRVGHLARDERCQQALAVAERFADGRATATERQEAATLATALCEHWDLAVTRAGSPVQAVQAAADAAYACYQAVILDPGASEFAVRAAACQAVWDPWAYPLPHPRLDPNNPHLNARRVERAAQWPLLQDIFGLPLPVPVLPPSWLTANNGAVPQLARAIYEEDRFGDLPLLAGALKAAGCDDPTLLDHCRARHSHVRGCWLVDLLLGQGGRATADEADAQRQRLAWQMSCYLVLDAPCPARLLPLTPGQTRSVGRGRDRDLILESGFDAWRYCIFSRDDAGVWVKDQDNPDGIYLGKVRLAGREWHRLNWGDEVRIARARLHLLAVDPTWLFWNEESIPRMAEGIRQHRAFERLPILADALEEAGCTEEALLAHCRSREKHTPSCWALAVLRGTGLP